MTLSRSATTLSQQSKDSTGILFVRRSSYLAVFAAKPAWLLPSYKIQLDSPLLSGFPPNEVEFQSANRRRSCERWRGFSAPFKKCSLSVVLAMSAKEVNEAAQAVLAEPLNTELTFNSRLFGSAFLSLWWRMAVYSGKLVSHYRRH